MNFAQRQRDPRKHLVGITAVILFHGFIVYALLTGLAKKVVDELDKFFDSMNAELEDWKVTMEEFTDGTRIFARFQVLLKK